MDESPQNLYAKNLQQSFGYPLRFPEPKPGLPSSYEEHGLHIGDVGYIDDVGMFEVLFNICFPLHHELHQAQRNNLTKLVGLVKFNLNEAPPIPNAFPSGRVICHGVQGSHGDNLNHAQSASCKFISCSTSGAILILPSGAVRQNLNKTREDEFRKLAEKCALDWCRFADCKSLYLITGVYKTSSWYLASFHDARSTGQIILERDDAGRYNWNSGCDYRKSPGESLNENQTVLISGFKIEVRGWDTHTVVEKLAPPPRGIWSQLTLEASSLLGILFFFWRRILSVFKLWTFRGTNGGVRVGRVPALSQPFHPSDIINRYLLDRNPNVQVAVTHDSQWLSMLEKNELPPEDMTEEERFRAFLEEHYIDGSNSDNVVYLQRKTDEPNNEDYNDLHKSALSSKTFSLPTSDNIRHIVITHMRAENTVTCLRRMPVGFYVRIQFDGTERRSKTKTVLVRDSVIEWQDEIILPMDPSIMVQFSINASFELEPTLGNGETFYMSEISVDNLAQAGSTYLTFSSGSRRNDPVCPSLLITIEERRFDYLVDFSHRDENLGCKDRSCVGVIEATDEGHNALLRYHRDYEVADLKTSVEHFTLALNLLPPNHERRAAALFNLAMARFINCQVNGTISDLDAAIASYREALELRPAPLPDRPGTLLHLAQALLYRHGRLQCETSFTDEIERLMEEVKQIRYKGSYEHRAADLVVQTLKQYQVLTSGKLAEVEKLVSELVQSARTPPDWYFDKPYRMINLSAALRKRFELTGNLDHLERSISVIEEATKLISDSHFDQPWMRVFLGDVLCIRFVRRGHVTDLNRSISMIEDAVNLTPDGHVEKPWIATRLGAALLVRFICGNTSDLNVSISMTGSAVHLIPKARLDQLNNLSMSIATGTQCTTDFGDLERAISMHRDTAERLLDGNPRGSGCLVNLASSLLIRFWCLSDLSDLEEAVSRYTEAINLIPDNHPDKPACLNNVALSLRTRFGHLGELSDLEDAISRHKDAVELIPDGHPDKPSHLNNLGNCFVTRFEQLGELSDIGEAISNLMDAVKLTPDGHPDKPNYLNDLTRTLKARFEHLSKLTDLGFLRIVKPQ